MSKKQIESLGEVLAALTQKGDLGVRLRHALIWQQWDAIAGTELAQHGAPLGVRDTTLYVEVSGPVWMHRYAYAKQELLDRIREVVGGDLIAELFIRLKYDD